MHRPKAPAEPAKPQSNRAVQAPPAVQGTLNPPVVPPASASSACPAQIRNGLFRWLACQLAPANASFLGQLPSCRPCSSSTATANAA